MEKRREKPNVYLVTVERQRLVSERRTVRVVAYTADAAKIIAKQKRPGEGWEYHSVGNNQNSAKTTTFLDSHIELVGVDDGIPTDPKERHALLNDSTYVVRVKGEF